jgi:two-component system chemotaxis response regulator CheY
MSAWNEPRDGHHRHTVLVVEDHDDARSALVMALQLDGCEVASVADGTEAVEQLREARFRPCVIVLDLILPKMDGFTFHDWQQQSPGWGAIPVIALTGHEGLRRHALDKGFAAALLKPASVDDLCALLGKHCNGRTA